MAEHDVRSKQNYGQLYIVATPIGNLQDISPRAIDTLNNVDVIAAEDTRHSGHLLKQLDINTHRIALHEHNERDMAERLTLQIIEGKNIALISDAGTPLVSDPGYHLVKLSHQKEIKVVPIPGPSALIAALSAAGLATDRFCFEGFVPSKRSQRKSYYAQRVKEVRTMVFYETPHRIVDSLVDLCGEFGDERRVVMARELTKTFETIRNDTAKQLLQWVVADTNQQKGEIVLVVEGFKETQQDSLSEFNEHVLRTLLNELSLKQAVQLAVDITGEKKKKLYNFALSLKDET
ncbi:MAG: 16S rRNA (cytidine(1402)-2'-O)-methyltransferase [Proteobacteria bacterium]|nr:16S rRNA (cytidine(1402)-2'-O)-methyltransferase [Pseudomonadota bacterium]